MRYSLYMEFNSVMNSFFLNRFRNNDEISLWDELFSMSNLISIANW